MEYECVDGFYTLEGDVCCGYLKRLRIFETSDGDQVYFELNSDGEREDVFESKYLIATFR